MERAIEVTATYLGLLVRGIWMLGLALPQLAAVGLILYGIWLFDPRIAYIVAGLFLLANTRPKRRQDR